jgi:hypothetical protein
MYAHVFIYILELPNRLQVLIVNSTLPDWKYWRTTDVSEESFVSDSEEGISRFLRNVSGV